MTTLSSTTIDTTPRSEHAAVSPPRRRHRRTAVTAGLAVMAVLGVVVLLVADVGQSARAHGDVTDAPRLTTAVDAGQPVTDALPAALRGGLQGMVARSALPAGHVLVTGDMTHSDSPGGGSIALDLASAQFPANLVYGQTVAITGRPGSSAPVGAFVDRIHPTARGALITVTFHDVHAATDLVAAAGDLRLVGLR